MPGSSSSGVWLGVPPVTGDGFAYTNGDFFAVASGHNQHRRATQRELKTLFASGKEKDRPAHWFEAQLLHYGLQSSKTKAVARMRLWDAVNAGSMMVPKHILALEGKLKKEWSKTDREAKKEPLTSSITTKTKTTTTTISTSKTVTIKGTGAGKRKVEDTTQTSAKKLKTTAPRDGRSAEAPSLAKATASPVKKSFARCRRGGQASGPGRDAASSPTTSARPKQTARRGGSFSTAGRGATRLSPHLPRSSEQRSDASTARGRVSVPASQPAWYAGRDASSDDAPPPYSMYEEDEGRHDGREFELAPLGLLNGYYNMSSNTVTSE